MKITQAPASLLNRKLSREARQKLKRTIYVHENVRNLVRRDSVALFEQRQRAVSEVVEVVEAYVNQAADRGGEPRATDMTPWPSTWPKCTAICMPWRSASHGSKVR